MSYNQEVYDRIVQHLADTRLYELEAQQNVGSIVKRHRVRLRDLLVRNIKSDARPEIERTMKELNSSVSTSAQEYSGAAVTFHTNNLNKAVGSFFRVQQPKGFDVLKEIIGPNIETGRTLEKHFNAIGTAELVRVQGIIGRGLAQGDSREVIIQRVLETTKMSETQTRALVRTSITRTESVALDRVMTENADILDGYRFTAVLDANTSAICSAHDGKIYPLNEVRYRPPLHWNCRSSLVPVLKAKTSMEQIESKRLDKDALAKVPTKKLSGTPIDKEDYSVWLKRQPMEVKVSHLGNEERVALFEKGTLSVKEFFTSKGRGLSIGALRRLDNKRTSIFPTRQAALAKSVDDGYTVNVARPYDLTRSIDQQNKLRAMYISDADSMNQAISVTDFKGTSLAGKRTSRMRANNEFDERVVSYDPFTGEMKNTLLYDPDFGVYQERLDFLKQSKLLTADQKDFIANFAESLEDKISVNQQAVVVENLRVIFERYAKDKKPWENFMNVARGESQYSVVNVSRILDRRSRERADLFGSYMSGEEPKVQIFGNYYSFNDLQENLLENQRYVDTWNIRHGYDKARDAFYSKQTPLRQFFFDPKKTKKTKFTKVLGKWAEANIPGYKLYKDWDKPTETMLQKAMRDAREEYRNIVDLEFIFQNNKAGFIERMLSQKFLGGTKTKSIMEQAKEDLLGDAKGIEVITKVMNLVADGKSTDYDALAINIGKTINENWTPLFPFSGVTMADHHQAGSRILEALREQKKIRVISRGKVRRAAIDIDTGRPNGPWKETVSREVSILDKDMLDLQIRNRQLIIAQRIGVVSDRDKLYVRPGEKTYFDARGNNTGQSVITRRASGNYDKVLIDRDFADMLNHTMDVEYEVDRPFASFMDEIVRFRDPRGNVQKYDDLNDFRKLILQRGEQGFGFMQTVKWHMQRDKPFKAIAQIDGRGRVYYQGYLTPTGGEVVRPFLNSAKAMEVDNIALKELTIQIGSMLGPATEALTQAGRFEIFMRNEADVLSLGKLMTSNTQRDRRMREFLEHPIIRAHDAEEIPKVARLALEYTRIHEHFKGDFTNMSRKPYYTKLMIENDASSSGAQIIGLSTGDRSISINSNVLATDKKNRLYDLVAMDTASDPEFHAIQSLSGANIQWTDLAKAAKAQNMVSL